MTSRLKRLITIVAIMVLLLSYLCFPAYAVDDGVETTNRYNVVVVLDASGSMDNTDPANLRFEAIGQFVNLLAEEGNWLGGVVFSDGISAQQDVTEINSQGKKAAFVDLLRGVKAKGWTNTGEALSLAVDMLESGDPNLPSVFLFLSDGNTELG